MAIYRKKLQDIDLKNLENILINEVEIIESKRSATAFIFLCKSAMRLLYTIAAIVAIEIAILSVVIFWKVRSDQLDVHFAKNLILKNIENISFSNVAIGWDFDYNKFTLILNNVTQKSKGLLIREIRMYPNIKDLLHFKLNIEKIAIISPSVEINFNDNDIYLNRDLLHDFGKKKEDLLKTSMSEVLDTLQNFYANKIDITDGYVIVKNKNFVVAQVSNLFIKNDTAITEVSMDLRNKSGAAKLAFKVDKLKTPIITSTFENLRISYIKKFIKMPDFIDDAILSGNMQFNWLGFLKIAEGKFDLTCADAAISASSKKYSVKCARLSGNFNENSVTFSNISIKDPAMKCIVSNIEYNLPRNVLQSTTDTSVFIENFNLPPLDKSDNIPFKISNASIINGNLNISGELGLNNGFENRASVNKYKVEFENAHASLDDSIRVSNAAGTVTYDGTVSKVNLTRGQLDDFPIQKESNLTIEKDVLKVSLNTELPLEFISESSLYQKNPILSKLGTLNGTFSGSIDATLNRVNDFFDVTAIQGKILGNNEFLDKNYLYIHDTNLQYKDGALSISGFLKKNKSLSFYINSNNDTSGKFQIIGDINVKTLSLLGFDTATVNGFANIVLSGNYTDQFYQINTKADLTNTSIELFKNYYFKREKTKGVLVAESIIRGNSYQNEFNITTPEKALSGHIVSVNDKISRYDLTYEDTSRNESINLLANLNNNVWDAELRGHGIGILHKIPLLLKDNGTAANLKLIVMNSKYDDVPVQKLAGNISLKNGNVIASKIKGNLGNNKLVIVNTTKDDEGLLSTTLVSNDAGSILKILGVSDEVQQGNMRLQVISNIDRSKYNGTISVTNFSIANSKYIHNIISLTSPIGGTLSDKITFNSLTAQFRKNGKFVHILNGQAISPSIWLTIIGVYNVLSKNLKITGVTAPMHTYITQKQILMSNYLITGTLESPIIEASPLSETSKENLLKKFQINNNIFIFGN